MPHRAKVALRLAFAVSLCVHGMAYASLARAPLARAPRAAHSQLSFELREPPPALPAPATRSESTTRAEPMRVESKTPARAPLAPRAPIGAASPPATALAPAPALDLSGVTLTNDGGTGFAMPTGDGSALGRLLVGGRAVSNAAAPNAPAARPMGRRALVASADLSERPRPPSLTELLRENYPAQAKQRGLRGSARVRARIDADGVIRSVQLLSESASGFGAACRRTVHGSRWSAPKDKNGGAVATEIVYTCHFEVGP